ncbi:hypothetical protein U27_01353 [Candidatus Vecturithrix granuli]|uniref:Methyltransferase type 12 domain-containing protein n=1 Tax=Vecturithrix granuli TaxID=1499967 RepID=A0A081CA48_VECG1|nr:hypothetical protein U27_01353 [Candidatus Vecturithrix granuli]
MMNVNETYQKFADYYDAYAGAFDKDLAFYTSLCRPDEKILEVGCGTGRVLQRFLNDGFQITGVDISDEMLAVAKQKLASFCHSGNLVILHHNFFEHPLPEVYDRVLVTWFTFNYILETPENFLKNLVASMDSQAMLAMDVFYPRTFTNPNVNDVWTTRQLTYHGRVITVQDKRTVSGDMEERIQIYRENGKETHIHTRRKYYPPHILKQLLECAGLMEIMFSEQYESNAFKPTLEEHEIVEHFVVNAKKP